MNGHLVAAAVLAAMLGIAHSVLGELYLLRHLGKVDGIAPITPYVLVPVRWLTASDLLSKRTIRMVWHALTALGWATASILARYAARPLDEGSTWTIRIIAIAFLACALLFLVGTRLRHPGGVAFAALAVLSWLGASGGR
jgi:hypothetical protein